MPTLNYNYQLNYTGSGYLDSKMQPVATVADLNKIPLSQRFIGLTVTVLDDGSSRPYDYWIQNNPSKWVKKTAPTEEGGEGNIPVTGDDVEKLNS